MGFGKYTKEEKKIVHKITDLMGRQVQHRKAWLRLDIRRTALINSLMGKYEPKR